MNPPFSPLNHISSRFIQWWSAGYFPAAVDALWILMLSKIGTGQYHPQTLGEMTRFYQLATELDPDFFELYDQAGVLFCFFYESPESAELILTRGIEHFESGSVPQAFWRRAFALYMHLAYAQAFLAQDWAKAKQTYIRAAGVPHAPAFLGHFRSWLEQEGSEKKLAIRVLRLLVQTTQDEKIREKYREKLKQYES